MQPSADEANDDVRGRTQMTSCENRQFLPPSLPSVMVRHYCLDPPSEQKMTSSWPDPPPPNFFNYFMHIIIIISL